MQKSLLLFICLFISTFSFAQKFALTGIVLDSAGKPLEGAGLIVQKSVDSSLVGFGRTKTDGTFLIRNLPQGTAYTLKVTFVGYDAFLQDVPADFKGEKFDAGGLRMTPLSNLLDAALVVGVRDAVTIKNDTIEHNAAAYKLQPNATTEDLLKRLPGVEVDKDGKVTAQGEEVKQIFVNGKKFFSNDPKVATQNLPAGAVKKIQVYDKKSDQSELSGVDDGSRERTMNIELQDNFKNGTFGNITAGAGKAETVNDPRYLIKGALNRFSPNQQLSLLGLGNNVNRQGFSSQDYLGYTGAARNMMAGGGMRSLNLNANESSVPLDFGRNSGFTSTWAGGVNLNQTFSPKLELNGNYFFNHSDRLYDRSTQRQNFLPNRTYSVNSISNSKTLNDNHRLGLTLTYKLDSFNTLRLTSNSSYTENTAFSDNTSDTKNDKGFIENLGKRTSNTEGSGLSSQNSLLWSHRFKKRGRVMTANLNYNLGTNESNALQDNDNDLANLSGGYRNEKTIQRDIRESSRETYGTNLTYTEPIGKRNYLELNYNYQKTDNNANRNVSVVETNNPRIDSLLKSLNNDFDNDFIYNRGGVGLRMVRKEYNMSGGLNVQHSILRGFNLTRQTEVKPNPFLNFLPTYHFNLTTSMTSNAGLDYDTDVREPSVDQLQPIVDNSDPLNISIGNPDLRPEYNHRLRLRYNKFNQVTRSNFYSNVNFVYTLNRITYAQTFGQNAVRTSKPVNIESGVLAANIFAGFSKRFDERWRVGVNLSPRYNESINLVDNVENFTKNTALGTRLDVSYSIGDTFYMAVRGNVTLNDARYSLQSQLNRQFYNHNYEVEASYLFPLGIRLNSTFDYQFFTGQTFGANQTIPIWNASVSKTLLKNKRGEIKFEIFDILNKNTGFNRTAGDTYIQDELTQSLSRYFLLSFTYALNPMMGGGRGGRGMERRIMMQ